MDIIESFRLAFMGIAANKFRSFLTMLGIIIGVGSVIAMISIGEGGQNQIVSQISSMGSGTLTLSGGRGSTTLTLEVADYIRDRTTSVAYMYPSSSFGASVKVGSETRSYSIVGTSEDFIAVQNWQVATGSFISQNHIDTRNMVCVVGKTICDELFSGRTQIVGETLRINGQVFEVVGVMAERGSSLGMRTDNQIFIPISTALRLRGTKTVSSLTFLAKTNELSKFATAEIKQAMREYWAPDVIDKAFDDYVFNISSMDDLLETVNEAIGTFTLLLAGIAGISLLVGGIGIMNIMLVSVTERTREIGVRKALGAKRRDILSQFLIEAMMVSLTGGLIGMAIGIGGSNLVAAFAGWDQVVSTQAVTLAISFSMAIGLFFGIYPANKAARMDPIEALRYQ